MPPPPPAACAALAPVRRPPPPLSHLCATHLHRSHAGRFHHQVMYQRDAGQRSWHYDGSDFVVTLKLQNADEGGEFEYAPFIRGPCDERGVHDERFDQIGALFDGTYKGEVRPARRDRGPLGPTEPSLPCDSALVCDQCAAPPIVLF